MKNNYFSLFLRAAFAHLNPRDLFKKSGSVDVDQHKGYDQSNGRKLPKGYRDHNSAGTKIARMATARSITMRGRISNN